ncbi:MAG: hypothetical protein JWM44_819 [Bacilli bacterium]|nr:hypothetical protein [Bacilli bacterium]
MRIAYFIMVHQYAEQFALLLDAIQHPDNIYLIHVDAKSSTEFEEHIKNIGSKYSNMHFLKRQSVRRCLWSLTEVQLHAIEYLLSMTDQNWDYFINLSGQCFPLKSQNYIMNYLANNQGNYIGLLNSQDPLVQKDSIYRQRNHYKETNTSTGFDKLTDQGQLLNEFSAGKYNYYTGSGWFFLTREFCDFVVNSEVSKEIKPYMKTVFISDESYIQTILMNGEFAKKPLFPYKRFISMNVQTNGSHPVDLKEGNFIELIISDAFFARKFDITQDAAILKMLQFHIGGK